MDKVKTNSTFPGIRQLTGFILGPAACLALAIFGDLEPGKPEVTYTAAIAILMAIWWITEVIPLWTTSLLPVVLFPVLGILDGRAVSSSYFNDVIFLFIGGFLVAIAMERWDLHKRIALKILTITGTSPARILLGFMLATAIISMWISNTATAMMMIPILLSVIRKLEENAGKEAIKRYATGLLLGMAYSASIGGIATIVGTPPNQVFISLYHIMFPQAPEISFAQWMLFATPLSFILLGIWWLYLLIVFRPAKGSLQKLPVSEFRSQYRSLGPMTFQEKVVLVIFIILAILWISRADLAFGKVTIPGWSRFFGNPSYLNDGTVGIFIALILFLFPSGKEKGDRILNMDAVKHIPWDIVLLFGGGFALADAFMKSGLSLWLGSQLSAVSHLHPIWVILFICLLITFLTEMTSNTATAQMALPVLAALSVSTGVNPVLYMLPATISASMAFMLPVATPPNAIIFSSGRVRIADMARTGFWLNLIGAVVITLFTWFIARAVFNIDLNSLPSWAVNPK